MSRILIVDDEPMSRQLLHDFLAGDGHVLVQAESGEEALILAEREPPDLVLLDVLMPGLGGFEATRRLKAQAGDKFLPIILLTSLTGSSDRLRGLEMGADEFLSKPVDRQELSVRVRNLLALRAKDTLLAEKNMSLAQQNVTLAELHRFKDEMSALLVHDLKNPISVILGYHAVLARGLAQADESCRQALEDSRASGKYVLRLLANLLDIARLEASQLHVRRAPTNMAALLSDITQERTQLAQSRKIVVEVTAGPDLVVDVDPDLLARVAQNIIDNAFHHTPRGGRIDVRALALTNRIHIEIGNTGSAIPVEARAVIFEKFGQASPTVGRMNLGLGLYFCRLAIEAHGGRIWVEETPALPTVFVMDLPLSGAPAVATTS